MHLTVFSMYLLSVLDEHGSDLRDSLDLVVLGERREYCSLFLLISSGIEGIGDGNRSKDFLCVYGLKHLSEW